MAQFINAKQATELIKDGSFILLSGFVGICSPEEIFIEMEKSFLEKGTPKNLGLMWAAGVGGDVTRGLIHFSHKGMVGKGIGGHWGLAPKLADLVNDNDMIGYNLPQGVVSQMFRDMGAGKPGTISHVGLGTFVDPDLQGGKLNSITKEDIVEKVKLNGTEVLFYHAQKADFAILRGTYADDDGNISMANDPLTLELLSAATAAKNSGGKVIVQVKEKVVNGTLQPKDVKIPGILVDYVVVAEDPANSKQTFGEEFNPEFISRKPGEKPAKLEPAPFNERKVIARRCAMLLTRDKKVLNYGIGMPEVIPAVLNEEGQEAYFTATVEPGAVGGTPQGGLNFGASVNPKCIIDQPYMFDFYDGGGLDMAFLGLAQCDVDGNINVSKFGPKVAGAGGFINITQNAKEVVFCGTFTAGGLKLDIQDGKLIIVQEGKSKKFLKEVEQITFSGKLAQANGKKVTYVTERAVFELRKEGLTLTEIAPGVELEKDILALMDFKPIVADDLKTMDARIFTDAPMGLEL